jgi:asparagine synthase (glutamine-hydrolysing)
MVTFNEKHELLLLLYGEIYNTAADNQLKSLVEEYDDSGLEFAKLLNGSFSVILVDIRKDCVAVITDRVNSRRVYLRTYDSSHWVSNCLYSLPLTNVKLDHTGIAWYLVNKAVFRNRTLFDSVRILERASVHEINSDKILRRQYWNYHFNSSCEGIEKSRLKAELSDILVESVRRRTSDESHVFLSLSAGYDATTILGLMRYKLKMEGVKCFSYFRGKTLSKDADAYLAHEIAKIAGYDHRLLQGYHGNIIEWIDKNGAMSNGTSACGEIKALIELFGGSNQSNKRRVFIGDECFGWVDRALESPRDVLSVLYIYDWSSALLLSELIEEKMCLRMQEGMAEDQKGIVAKFCDTNNLHDLKDILYLDQRMSNYILPHKEYYMGNFVSVTNPFLDNDILDFMMKIPVPLRLDKRLFKETATEMFPQLFTINRAKFAEFKKDWGNEFTRCQKEIETLLLSRKSILDDLIPPEKIIKFMENSQKTFLTAKIFSKVKSSRSRIHTAFGIKGAPERPRVPQMDRAELLRRVLVLRSFLNHSVDRQQGI